METPLAVTRLGRDVYHVRSEVPAKAERYMCEIPNPENPHGQCSCKDWVCRIGGPLNRGEEPDKSQCKHIARVLALLDGWRQVLEMHEIQDVDPAEMIPWA